MNEKIDVLAVVDTTIKLAQEGYIPEHHEVVALEQARAAIAELIEAAVLAEESLPDDNRLAVRLRAAISRVRGEV